MAETPSDSESWDIEDLYALNDNLTQFIAERGLIIDDDSLNNLTHTVAALIDQAVRSHTVNPNIIATE